MDWIWTKFSGISIGEFYIRQSFWWSWSVILFSALNLFILADIFYSPLFFSFYRMKKGRMKLYSRQWEEQSTRLWQLWSLSRFCLPFAYQCTENLTFFLIPSKGFLQLDIFYFHAEKNCWSSSDHFNWIHGHNWYMGASRGRPASVRGTWFISKFHDGYLWV